VKELRRAWGGDLFHLEGVVTREMAYDEHPLRGERSMFGVSGESQLTHIVDPVPCYPVEASKKVQYGEQGDERRVKVVPESQTMN
jgi:hypothetical protein